MTTPALTCSVSFNVDESTFGELDKLHKITFKGEPAPVALTARYAFKTGLVKLLRDAKPKRGPKAKKPTSAGE